MALLQSEDVQMLKESFAEIKDPVTLTLVARERSRLVLPGAEPQGDEDAVAQEIGQLLDEIAATSEKLTVARSAPSDGELTPAIVFRSTAVKGELRYIGVPAGYEMSTLVSTILDAGAGEPLVPDEVVARIDALPSPVHIQVFVTPS